MRVTLISCLHEVACLAHCRRYWFKELDSARDQVGPVLYLIHKLYRVEDEAKDFDTEQRWALRQKRSRPLWAELRTYLDELVLVALPKSPVGSAISYTLNQWAALNRYCDDGDRSIDNNATERVLRGIAVGRRT